MLTGSAVNATLLPNAIKRGATLNKSTVIFDLRTVQCATIIETNFLLTIKRGLKKAVPVWLSIHAIGPYTAFAAQCIGNKERCRFTCSLADQCAVNKIYVQRYGRLITSHTDKARDGWLDFSTNCFSWY